MYSEPFVLFLFNELSGHLPILVLSVFLFIYRNSLYIGEMSSLCEKTEENICGHL